MQQEQKLCGFQGAMDELTEDECQKLLDKFENVDERGRYAGFSDVIVYQLKKPYCIYVGNGSY